MIMRAAQTIEMESKALLAPPFDLNRLQSANFSLNENPCYKINTPWLDIHLICVSKQFVSRETRAAESEHGMNWVFTITFYPDKLIRSYEYFIWVYGVKAVLI